MTAERKTSLFTPPITKSWSLVRFIPVPPPTNRGSPWSSFGPSTNSHSPVASSYTQPSIANFASSPFAAGAKPPKRQKRLSPILPATGCTRTIPGKGFISFHPAEILSKSRRKTRLEALPSIAPPAI